MTESGIKEDNIRLRADSTKNRFRSKISFFQKYYHKGGFSMTKLKMALIIFIIVILIYRHGRILLIKLIYQKYCQKKGKCLEENQYKYTY